MMPLQVCTRQQVWRMEERWMRTTGAILNKEQLRRNGER